MNFSYMEVGLSRRKSEHIQIPTALLDNPVFRDVSLEAKVLYSRMYNRVFLSARNPERFSDREGRLYIYYSQSEVPFVGNVPRDTRCYGLMATDPREGSWACGESQE
ncbi:replication initiator protein A [Oscillospiraceae bacterium 21-37]